VAPGGEGDAIGNGGNGWHTLRTDRLDLVINVGDIVQVSHSKLLYP
jgi:hypothetical protein